jgi:general secretion pathway protein G
MAIRRLIPCAATILASLSLGLSTAAQTPATKPAAPLSPADIELIRRVQCADNLGALAKAAVVYAVVHDDKFPPDLGTLLLEGNVDISRFICPAAPSALPANWQKLSPKDQAAWVNAHSDYILVRPNGVNDTDSEKPLIYEKDDDHKGGGMGIAYSDSHTRFLPLADVHKQIGPTAGAERKTTRVAPAPGQAPSIPLISLDGAKAINAQSALSDLSVALHVFEMDLGRYPTTAEGLAALTAKPAANAPAWHGPYLPKTALDPWGHPFLYTYDGKNFHLSSPGPDGKPNTRDDVKLPE